MRTLISRLFTILLATLAGATFAQQVCPLGLTQTAPDSRYTVQTDPSQVLDNKTKLIWQRCIVGQTWSAIDNTCTGTARVNLSWNDGFAAASEAGTSGGFAWRVPNIKELASLIEWACQKPAMNNAMFPKTSNGGPQGYTFLTSSTKNEDRANAVIVNFDYGSYTYYEKTNAYFNVRLVRSSQ